MYRVLKPNGRVIVLDPVTDGLIRKLAFSIECIFMPNEKQTHRYTKLEMNSLFHEAGFKNLRQNYLWNLSAVTIGEK